ncbi:MAG: glutathione S-transferase N-terminal domain-containing protein, partial [Luminiphilus sp.]|nr:glutathione S-transferase N-terminal domain-containing protein [Luminiphilus sp.]
MPHPILHHYDASPFSQKAQKMMGIKGLTWQSVEMPMTAPKPDIEAITGGYRGTPVLQVGSDIFIDTVAIADALDHFFPEMAVLCDAQRLHSD